MQGLLCPHPQHKRFLFGGRSQLVRFEDSGVSSREKHLIVPEAGMRILPFSNLEQQAILQDWMDY